MTLFEILLDKPLDRWSGADYWKMRGTAFMLGMLLWLVLAGLAAYFVPYGNSLFRVLLSLSVLWALVLLVMIGVATTKRQSEPF